MTKEKAFEIMEWIFFIGFSIVAGCFASGVLEQFFSRKTSFSQHEGVFTKYPVISLVFVDYQASEVNQTNVNFTYQTTGMEYFHRLEIGENHFPSDVYNKTETVILESLEDIYGRRAFRIIHSTPILNKRGSIVDIGIYTKLEKKNETLSDVVIFYLTSQDNSPGFIDSTWKDGKPLQIAIKKDTLVRYNLEPQMTKYLEQMGKCQEEAYYKCIASQIDASEFTECTTKCIPNIFSNLGNNYSTSFCDNDTASQKLIFNQMMEQRVGFNCKKSCSNLEYVGEFVLDIPYQSEKENWNIYLLEFKLTNQDFVANVWEEYLIYDIIGMMGSVGGTLGIFIEF